MRTILLVAAVVGWSCVPGKGEADAGVDAGHQVAACELEVPAELQLFGDLVEGDIKNVGAHACTVSALTLESSPAGTLALSGASAPLTLQANESVRITVMRVGVGLVSSAAVHVVAENGTVTEIPVRVTVPDPLCFVMTPSSVDFGSMYAGCGSPTRSVMLSNTCDAPLTWTASALSHGFQFVGVLPTDNEVLAGQSSRVLSLRFQSDTDNSIATEALRIARPDGFTLVSALTAQVSGARAVEDTYVTESNRATFYTTTLLVESSIAVTIDDQPATGWTYDRSASALTFTPPVPANARVVVRGNQECL